MGIMDSIKDLIGGQLGGITDQLGEGVQDKIGEHLGGAGESLGGLGDSLGGLGDSLNNPGNDGAE